MGESIWALNCGGRSDALEKIKKSGDYSLKCLHFPTENMLNLLHCGFPSMFQCFGNALCL